MKHKFKYTNQEERNNIIESNKNKFLIEEQNLFEGNFLIFVDTKSEIPEAPEATPSIEYRLQKLEEKMQIVIGELESLTGKVLIRA